jgi:hypothetical protein
MSQDRSQPELDAPARKALDRWAVDNGLTWELGEILTGGATDALVATIFVSPKHSQSDATRRDLKKRRARKLVLKICPPRHTEEGEAARHLEAWQTAPVTFRKSHLLEQPLDPFPLGDGRSFMFQEFGAASGVTSLSTQLSDTGLLASRCKAIVGALLDDWNSDYTLEGRTVSEFLRWQLGWRLERGSQLRTWVESRRSKAGQSVSKAGQSVMPDPLALALGELASQRLVVAAGQIHGDLHSGNILVPSTDAATSLLRKKPAPLKPSTFWLIDLSDYASKAPLATDPIHFLLSIVARHLEKLTPPTREALISYLTTSDPNADADVPVQLHQVTEAISKAMEAWVAPLGISDEWSDQITLSLIGCGLMYAGRMTLPDDQRSWFFRLASRATAVYLKHLEVKTSAVPKLSVPSPTTQAPSEITSREPGSQDTHQEVTAGPPDGLEDLSGEQTELLRASAAVFSAFLERSGELAGTSRLAPRFAELYVRAERSHTRLKEQLEILEEMLRAATWPHTKWAMTFASQRARAQQDLQELERRARPGSIPGPSPADPSYQGLRETVTTLQTLIVDQYPSIVRTGN